MKTHLDLLKERRRVLQNPYAYADELDSLQSLAHDRLRLENPYAHIERIVDGARPIARFDGIQQRNPILGKAQQRRRTDSELQSLVRSIHLRLWTKRNVLFGDGDIDPVDVLDPLVALENEHYQVEERDTLGQYTGPDGTFEVAGSIDKRSKSVRYSRQYSRAVQKFTLAHELGHAVLHDSVSMHRDRALDGTRRPIDPEEREADRFATLFLMPEKLVRRAFEDRFGSSSVRFDERASFAGKAPKGLSLRRAAAVRLASVTQFGGLGFRSLSEYFGVSSKAMAIRLEELKLFVLSNNLPPDAQR